MQIQTGKRGTNLGTKIDNGGNYTHAQVSIAYNFCLSMKVKLQI